MPDESLTEIERQLLMAAALQGLGPHTDLGFANTVKVLVQVLRWRGLSDEEIGRLWDDGVKVEIDDEVYPVLIRMVRQTAAPLFEGGGNWGGLGEPDRPPSWPDYNSCRLTVRGHEIANDLLARYPEYGQPVNPSRVPPA